MAKKKAKKKAKIVDAYEKETIATPKKPKVEKITVTDISQPTPAELALRISVIEGRIDALISRLKSSKGLKGI